MLAFVLARFSVSHGVQLCRVFWFSGSFASWECDVVRVLSVGAACGMLSACGVSCHPVAACFGSGSADGLPLVVWCRFGMVSAAPLTDGHSSIGGCRSGHPVSDSRSSVGFWSGEVSEGHHGRSAEKSGRVGGSLIMTHIRAMAKNFTAL